MRQINRDWEAECLAFHAQHPEVYAELVRLTREAKFERCYSTVGIELIVNLYRWNNPGGLNQNYKATYARLIMEQEPDLKGFFNMQRRRTAPDEQPSLFSPLESD